MNTHELLIAARKKIERPECWTTGWWARNAVNDIAFPTDSDAVCWCGFGAVRAVGCHDEDIMDGASEALNSACGASSFPLWQDAPERTHEEVLKVFDIAIENTRGEG